MPNTNEFIVERLRSYTYTFERAAKLFGEVSAHLRADYIGVEFTGAHIETVKHAVLQFCEESKLKINIDVLVDEPKLVLVGRTVEDQIIVEALQTKYQQL